MIKTILLRDLEIINRINEEHVKHDSWKCVSVQILGEYSAVITYQRDTPPADEDPYEYSWS